MKLRIETDLRASCEGEPRDLPTADAKIEAELVDLAAFVFHAPTPH
jgi:hypothetical protein